MNNPCKNHRFFKVAISFLRLNNSREFLTRHPCLLYFQKNGIRCEIISEKTLGHFPKFRFLNTRGERSQTSVPRYKNAPLPRLGEEVFGGTPPGPPLSVFVFSKEEEERRKKKEERRPCMHTCTPLCERVPWHDRTHQRAALTQAQSQHQARAAACRIASSFCARVACDHLSIMPVRLAGWRRTRRACSADSFLIRGAKHVTGQIKGNVSLYNYIGKGTELNSAPSFFDHSFAVSAPAGVRI